MSVSRTDRSASPRHGDILPSGGRYLDPPVAVRLTTQEREFLLALVKHHGMQAVVAATALEPTSARVDRAEMCAEIVLKLRKVT